MCPANMRRGVASGLRLAKELPATSAWTSSANRSASARQARAGAVSKEDGPGLSSRVFRKASESGVTEHRLQWQFEEHRSGNGIGAIRRSIADPELTIETDGGLHGRQTVEPHLAVPCFRGLLNDSGDQSTAQAGATKLGPHVQSLHLTDPGLERTQRHAT